MRTGATWRGKVDRLSLRVHSHPRLPCREVFVFADSFAGRCLDDLTWAMDGRAVELDRDLRLLYPASDPDLIIEENPGNPW